MNTTNKKTKAVGYINALGYLYCVRCRDIPHGSKTISLVHPTDFPAGGDRCDVCSVVLSQIPALLAK